MNHRWESPGQMPCSQRKECIKGLTRTVLSDHLTQEKQGSCDLAFTISRNAEDIRTAGCPTVQVTCLQPAALLLSQ
jgi:hypothetical protein